MFSFQNLLNWAIAFVCALFILIGRWSPMEATDVNILTDFRSLIIITLFTLLVLSGRKWTLDSKLCLALFPVIIFGISYNWSYGGLSRTYADSKFIDVCILAAFLILFRQVIFRRDLLNRVIIAAGLMAAVLGIIALLNPPDANDTVQNSRISTMGSGPITFGRILLTGAIIAITMRFRRLSASLVKIIIFILLSYGVLLTGSRGVVAGSLFAFISLFLIIMLKGAFVQRLFAALVGISGLFLYFGPEIKTGIDVIDTRILALIYNDELYLAGRDQIYENFFMFWPNHPWMGSGLAGFKDVSEYIYPHNLFLEYLFEVGILGFASLAAFLVPVLSICIFKYKTISLQLSALTLSAVGFVMFSGDFYDSRWVFIWGLACLCSAHSNRRNRFPGHTST